MSNSSSPNKEKILDALKHVMLPDGSGNVVDAGMISGVTLHGARVGFLIEGSAELEPLRAACEQAVRQLSGIEHVTAVLTHHESTPATAPVAREKAVWNHTPIEGIQTIIAIASGKGGVGKSSIAVLLALALAKQGKRVGILDADIYGPSIPTMLGCSQEAQIKSGKLIAQQAHGIALMSMQLIIGDQAAVMRAPRVTKALQQMLRQTDWGQLDTLLIDLPPGTGDVHLSMVQQAPINSALIITLASKVAAMDAKKSIEMFDKVGVPISGIIENMSYLPGGVTPFGSGGGEQLAAQTGYTLLAKLALEPLIGEIMNQGKNPFEANISSELLSQIERIAVELIKP